MAIVMITECANGREPALGDPAVDLRGLIDNGPIVAHKIARDDNDVWFQGAHTVEDIQDIIVLDPTADMNVAQLDNRFALEGWGQALDRHR